MSMLIEFLIEAFTQLLAVTTIIVVLIAFPIALCSISLPFIITKNDAREILAIVKEIHNV